MQQWHPVVKKLGINSSSQWSFFRSWLLGIPWYCNRIVFYNHSGSLVLDLYDVVFKCYVFVFQPKACAQHCSIFLVTNDIFRWVRMCFACYSCVSLYVVFYLDVVWFGLLVFLNFCLPNLFVVIVILCVYLAGLSLKKLKQTRLLNLLSKPLPDVS